MLLAVSQTSTCYVKYDFETSGSDYYIDLGSEIGLNSMYQDPLSGWNLSTILDDFVFGSSCIPAPFAGLLGIIGIGLVGWLRRGKKF